MKKVVYGLLTVAMVFLLTGCGKTTLTCKLTQQNVDLDYVMVFKGNVIKTMSLKYVINFSGKTDAEIQAANKQDYCSLIKSSMSQYKEGFENCNQKVDGSKIIVYTDINPNKITNNVFDKMGSIEETKTELEKIGYSCSY